MLRATTISRYGAVDKMNKLPWSLTPWFVTTEFDFMLFSQIIAEIYLFRPLTFVVKIDPRPRATRCTTTRSYPRLRRCRLNVRLRSLLLARTCARRPRTS